MYNHTGYYCTSGVDRSDPGSSNTTYNTSCTCPEQAVHSGIGGVCPLGYYCPLGSERPIGCDAGAYADKEGMAECSVCPQGYYCMVNATEFVSARCPAGNFNMLQSLCLSCVIQVISNSISNIFIFYYFQMTLFLF